MKHVRIQQANTSDRQRWRECWEKPHLKTTIRSTKCCKSETCLYRSEELANIWTVRWIKVERTSSIHQAAAQEWPQWKEGVKCRNKCPHLCMEENSLTVAWDKHLFQSLYFKHVSRCVCGVLHVKQLLRAPLNPTEVGLTHTEQNMHSHPPGIRSSTWVVEPSSASQFSIFTPELQILGKKKMCTASCSNSWVESACTRFSFTSSLLIMDGSWTFSLPPISLFILLLFQICWLCSRIIAT